jgi:hypothetical protein
MPAGYGYGLRVIHMMKNAGVPENRDLVQGYEISPPNDSSLDW